MLKQGVHPKIVQERLGHSDIALTLNTYSHVLPTLQNEAAAKMDELLTLIEYPKNNERINKLREKQDRGNVYVPSVR